VSRKPLDEDGLISRLSGRFRDDGLEDRYLEFRHGQDLQGLRWVLFSMIGLSALFSYVDWTFVAVDVYFDILMLRLGGLVPAVILLLYVRPKSSPLWTQRLTGLAGFAFLASILPISLILPPDPVSIAVAGALILSAYTVVPLLFVYRVVVSLVYTAGVVFLILPTLDGAVFNSNLFLLIAVNVLGIIADRSTGTARRNEYLLLQRIFPQSVIMRMQRGERVADEFPAVSILFADLVGFTDLSTRLNAREVVALLDRLFERFDSLCDQEGVEKIKTIGDSYMAAAGLPAPRADHAQALIRLARGMFDAVRDIGGGALQLRIGIHSGPVFAGVIGSRRQLYDLWGDTVNLASRMESQGVAGDIQISAATRALLGESYATETRGPLEIKGRGVMDVYLVRSASES
jgi:class 3 adenylate cyclase